MAAAPAAAPVAPATYGVLALAVAGVAAAAVANKGEDRAAPSASAQAPAPTPAATSSAGLWLRVSAQWDHLPENWYSVCIDSSALMMQ